MAQYPRSAGAGGPPATRVGSKSGSRAPIARSPGPGGPISYSPFTRMRKSGRACLHG